MNELNHSAPPRHNYSPHRATQILCQVSSVYVCVCKVVGVAVGDRGAMVEGECLVWLEFYILRVWIFLIQVWGGLGIRGW
jgi:hypothetical protein